MENHAIIKRLEIKGLWGKQDFTFDFHDDLNIFTGSNGSGKTTILRVMWNLLSRSGGLAKNENFSFPIKLYIQYLDKKILITRNIKDEEKNTEYVLINDSDNERIYTNFEDTKSNVYHLISKGENFFFPTYRRIEEKLNPLEDIKIKNTLEDYALQFSTINSRFVFYYGIDDIRNRINYISSDIRVKLEPLEKDFINFIANNSKKTDPELFTTQLNERLAEKQRQEAIITRPLTTFSRLIDELMLEKSVQVTDDLILGTHPNRVRLEDLSGGEKHLLSFMVYAMTQPAMMFIDEPELGMHVDWQRKFVEIMQAISPQTQYFIATHSAAVRVAYAENKFFLDDQMD